MPRTTDLLSSLTSTITQAAAAVGETLSASKEAVNNAVSSVAQAALSAASSAVSTVKEKLSTGAQTVKNAATATVQAVTHPRDTLKKAEQAVVDFVASKISPLYKDPTKIVIEEMEKRTQSLSLEQTLTDPKTLGTVADLALQKKSSFLANRIRKYVVKEHSSKKIEKSRSLLKSLLTPKRVIGVVEESLTIADHLIAAASQEEPLTQKRLLEHLKITEDPEVFLKEAKNRVRKGVETIAEKMFASDSGNLLVKGLYRVVTLIAKIFAWSIFLKYANLNDEMFLDLLFEEKDTGILIPLDPSVIPGAEKILVASRTEAENLLKKIEPYREVLFWVVLDKMLPKLIAPASDSFDEAAALTQLDAKWEKTISTAEPEIPGLFKKAVDRTTIDADIRHSFNTRFSDRIKIAEVFKRFKMTEFIPAFLKSVQNVIERPRPPKPAARPAHPST